MQNTPVVSVIVPVYNCEAYLEECLDSLLKQTEPNIEVICADDCSTDGSRALLARYAELEPLRVKVIYEEHNASASRCRRDAVLASRGEYIMFLDSDDYLELNAVETAVNAIRSRRVDILQFDTVVENCANLPQGRIDSNQKRLDDVPGRNEGDLLESCFLQKRFSFQLWNKIYRGDLCRRAMVMAEEGFFPKANDLYAMALILSIAKSYDAISIPLYHYCFGRGMTGQNVMTLAGFTKHCSSVLVLQALTRHFVVHPHPQSEALLQKLENDFLNEQLGLWKNNLIEEERTAGIAAMAELWGRGISFIVSVLAEKNFYGDRADIAARLRGAEFLKWNRRPIRTVALYYHSLRNGGAQHVVAQLANLFAEGGYTVLVITDQDPTEEDYPLNPAVIRKVIPDITRFPREKYRIRAEAWNRLLDEYPIDAFFCSAWVSAGNLWDMLVIKAHPSHPAYVFHSHNFCALPWSFVNNAPGEMRHTYAMADAVVTLSRVDCRYWQNINPRCYTIANPCFAQSDDALRTPGTGKSLLWLGRISAEKQPLEMIRVMKQVVARVPDAVCHMVGDGDANLLQKLRDRIADEGLENNIILEGFHREVDRFYQQADVYLMTSTYEGFPLVPFEAASRAVPTITYELPWLEYYSIIDGWDSVPQRDADGMAAAAVSLLTDRALWQERSDRIYESFRRYEQLDILQLWQAVLSDLEQDTLPEQLGMGRDEKIMLDYLIEFHGKGVNKLRAERAKAEQNGGAKRIRELEARVKELECSNSYRLGRFLSWPYRKLKEWVKKLLGKSDV